MYYNKNSINMKKMKLFTIMLTILIMSACSSTSNTGSSSNITKSKSGRSYASYSNLADILRQQMGLIVKGTGATAEITIRGMNSISLDTRPLYVYDGIQLGRSYARANSAVNLATIKSIRVIKDLSQLTFYGSQGRNGVIYIRSIK